MPKLLSKPVFQTVSAIKGKGLRSQSTHTRCSLIDVMPKIIHIRGAPVQVRGRESDTPVNCGDNNSHSEGDAFLLGKPGTTEIVSKFSGVSPGTVLNSQEGRNLLTGFLPFFIGKFQDRGRGVFVQGGWGPVSV
jgi:hypothetical protein